MPEKPFVHWSWQMTKFLTKPSLSGIQNFLKEIYMVESGGGRITGYMSAVPEYLPAKAGVFVQYDVLRQKGAH